MILPEEDSSQSIALSPGRNTVRSQSDKTSKRSVTSNGLRNVSTSDSEFTFGSDRRKKHIPNATDLDNLIKQQYTKLKANRSQGSYIMMNEIKKYFNLLEKKLQILLKGYVVGTDEGRDYEIRTTIELFNNSKRFVYNYNDNTKEFTDQKSSDDLTLGINGLVEFLDKNYTTSVDPTKAIPTRGGRLSPRKPSSPKRAAGKLASPKQHPSKTLIPR